MRLPMEQSLKRAIQRARNAVHPKAPSTLSQLRKLPRAFRFIDDTPFLIHDSEHNYEIEDDISSDEEEGQDGGLTESRILTFARPGALRDLA